MTEYHPKVRGATNQTYTRNFPFPPVSSGGVVRVKVGDEEVKWIWDNQISLGQDATVIAYLAGENPFKVGKPLRGTTASGNTVFGVFQRKRRKFIFEPLKKERPLTSISAGYERAGEPIEEPVVAVKEI